LQRDNTPKLETPEPEPEPAQGWTSEAWSKGTSRIVRAGEYDPVDPKLQLLNVGDIPPRAIINAGEIEVSGSSPRLYIDCPNQNVEFSAEVFVSKSVEICHLIARSNHEERPNGFGGYYLYVSMKDQEMYFKKEQTHVLGYSPRLQAVPVKFEKGKWYKMLIRVENTEGGVLVVGEFDGNRITQYDSGQLKGEPYTFEGKWCFVRTNKPDGVKYRNVVVREIK
jgi:hypothetical protein